MTELRVVSVPASREQDLNKFDSSTLKISVSPLASPSIILLGGKATKVCRGLLKSILFRGVNSSELNLLIIKIWERQTVIK